MLCCLGTPWSNSNDLYEQEMGDFPGNRRFQKTAGNALVAADSFNHQQQQQHQTTGLPDNNNGRSGDVVCVTIPPGVSPGQALLVTAPDGSGRTIMVTVPQGLSEGSTFMAEFPPSSSSPPSSPSVSSGQHAQVEAAPIDYSQVTPLAPPPPLPPAIPPPIFEQEPFAQAVPVGVGPHETTISPIPSTSNRRQISATNLPRSASPMASSFGQPMLRVQVPPGTPAGSTLYVSIPGENRTVPAVVPPNVSYFHVPYEPQQSQSNRTTRPPVMTVTPHACQNQKLLLVQVPPGIRAGETIHVSIPDEPGRLVAATVPPNVTQFQVAYQPMTNGNRSSGMTNARNASSFPQQQQQQQSANSRNGDGGMGSMLLPALGGAALGMMGMSMYDHSRHYSDNNYDENYNGNNDVDFGGGDFGAGNF